VKIKKYLAVILFFNIFSRVYALDTEISLPKYYIVENWFISKDSLWNIAANPTVYNDPTKWHVIYNHNKNIFPDINNPNLIIPGMVLEIPCLNEEYREGTYSSEIKNYAIPKFSELYWKFGGEIIKESIVDDDVSITFNTRNLPEDSDITITILEKNYGLEDNVVDILEITSKNDIIANWTINFDENKCRNSSTEIQENGYTIPEYCFVVKYGKYSSEESNIIKIKSWVKGKSYDDKLNITWGRNQKVTLIFGDGSEITTTSDNDGNVYVRDIPIGDVLYYFHADD
jgi:hypothetical protein